MRGCPALTTNTAYPRSTECQTDPILRRESMEMVDHTRFLIPSWLLPTIAPTTNVYEALLLHWSWNLKKPLHLNRVVLRLATSVSPISKAQLLGLDGSLTFIESCIGTSRGPADVRRPDRWGCRCGRLLGLVGCWHWVYGPLSCCISVVASHFWGSVDRGRNSRTAAFVPSPTRSKKIWRAVRKLLS
jgi:hypothetical protein